MTEKSKKDNLKEVNRYNDSAFPVGMYTVTVDGIEPEGQGIFINKNLLHVTNDLSEDGKYFSINFRDRF